MNEFTGAGITLELSRLEQYMTAYAIHGEDQETRLTAERVLFCLQGIKRERLEAAMRKATR